MNTTTLKTFIDRAQEGQLNNTVLFVQKGVADYVFGLMGGGSFGRKGYQEINDTLFFQVKTPQDIRVGEELFRGKDQFLVTGTDVMRKGEVGGVFRDTVLETLPAKDVWGSESTLSVFGPLASLREIAGDTPPDIVYTRGAPTLTESAIKRAYGSTAIDIREVDGNTEAYVALEANGKNERIVCGTEFVQTGKSLSATGSFVLGKCGIYTPERMGDGEFGLKEGVKLSERARDFTDALTLKVDVIFARIYPTI